MNSVCLFGLPPERAFFGPRALAEARHRNDPHRFIPALTPSGLGPWRKLAVEMGWQHIRVSWEGQVIYRLSRADVLEGAKSLRNSLGEPLTSNPEFTPRDGLGLFLYRSAASIRSVVIEPLTGENGNLPGGVQP
jgi:hypothetical protein